MSTEEWPVRRAVWRPPAPAARKVSDDEPVYCGGKELTVEERYQQMKERRRLRKEAEARAQEETQRSGRRRSGRDSDKEDDGTEKARDKRYAVKLLQQEGSAWGGSASGSGDIG